MRERMKERSGRKLFSVKTCGPRPGDYELGSLESRAAARMMVDSYADERAEDEKAELGKLSIHEEALVEGCADPLVRCYMVRLTRRAEKRARIYEQPLPKVTPDDIRHNRAVHKEIDRLTGGESSTLYANDSGQWNRLKVIAEQNLGSKEK
jgi:hypothetical protein